MKKIFTLLCVALAAVSCIDDDYDLGKVETGNITIGGDQTAFEMPLAQIVIGMTELRNGSSDVKAIFEEADIWLPSTLPGGTAYADIRRLTSASDSYLDQTVDLLFDEMAASQAKMDEVTDLIWRTPEYRNRFSEVISADEEALFKALFREYFSDEETGKVLRDLSGELARDYLSGIRVETVNYRIEGIDLGSDVVDMLVDNLDPEGTADPRNTLQIYGSVTSALPLSLQTSPTFTGTAIRMEPFAVGPDEQNVVPETRLYEQDLRQVIDDVEIVLPLELLRYYPDQSLDEQQQLVLKLHLRKRGGLSIDL